MQLKCTFDGACEPFNPGGAMGLGWTIGDTVGMAFVPEAGGNTNNVAEYLAMHKLLDYAVSESQLEKIEIAGDSQVVICQMTGEYAVKSGNLRSLHEEAMTKVRILDRRGCKVTFVWHRREHNERADAASKEALRLNGVELTERKPATGFGTQSMIGERLNMSAVRVGKLLASLGYRSGRDATQLALDEGLARWRVNGYGWGIEWNVNLTASALERAIPKKNMRKIKQPRPSRSPMGSRSR